jgi:hypothetical protein
MIFFFRVYSRDSRAFSLRYHSFGGFEFTPGTLSGGWRHRLKICVPDIRAIC